MSIRLIALAILFLATTCVSAQTTVSAQYFGMHLVKGQPWPTVPFSSIRLWDTDTRWQQMNPANGVYDFSTLDAYLALAHAHTGLEVVLVLGGTPNWISSDPTNTGCDYASTATGSCAPPADLNSDGTGTDQAWRGFIHQLATHVTGLNADAYSRVAAYEMWNEFSRSTESWTGTQAQMVRMAQDAYCILKGSGTITATSERCVAQDFHVTAVGVVPLAVVVSPSAQASGPDVSTLGDYFSTSGATTATDVIATHNYTYGSGCCASPEVLRGQWSVLRAALPAMAPGMEYGRKLGRYRTSGARPRHAVGLRCPSLFAGLVAWLPAHVLVCLGQFLGTPVEPERRQRLQRRRVGNWLHQPGGPSLHCGLLVDGRQHHDPALHCRRLGLQLPTHPARWNHNPRGVGCRDVLRERLL